MKQESQNPYTAPKPSEPPEDFGVIYDDRLPGEADFESRTKDDYAVMLVLLFAPIAGMPEQMWLRIIFGLGLLTCLTMVIRALRRPKVFIREEALCLKYLFGKDRALPWSAIESIQVEHAQFSVIWIKDRQGKKIVLNVRTWPEKERQYFVACLDVFFPTLALVGFE